MGCGFLLKDSLSLVQCRVIAPHRRYTEKAVSGELLQVGVQSYILYMGMKTAFINSFCRRKIALYRALELTTAI
jgi:hypothetical protein